MATAIPQEHPSSLGEALRQIRREAATYRGILSWIATVDHKRIGVLYGVSAFIFFLVGGIEALIIRLQLAAPGQEVIDSQTYNEIFTMHGTTMIFLVVMPMSAAFFNLLVPLMVGARDVAFPRLNAFSYWAFLMGALFINFGWITGDVPDSGWFAYAPLSRQSPGHGMDFWVLGLQILGISSMAGAFNFAVTILNMRAPGMSFFRMPVFVWMTLVTSFLIFLAMPVIAIALFQLGFDRFFNANFFNAEKGADPLLWQHLFWLFGHPEVYILILPAMGIVSEVLPTFSRKPLFGYAFVVASGIMIGFIGWGVWAHHMFTTGLGAAANAAFGVHTMIIAVPTGVKIFNWLGTLWGGAIQLRTPFLFAVGMVSMFIIGGLSGVTHAVVPSDFQQQDTYYIVAHFHYVLFGGAIFGLFSGIYYWYPKFTGRLMSEGIGKVHFWLMLIGFNLTFFPHHMLGLLGMPRRIYSYPEDMGWDVYNMISTVGAFVIALSISVFILNIIYSQRRGRRVGADPWDGRTLEWTISSPPLPYNFAEIPTVHARDEAWQRKYVEDEHGRVVRVPAGAAHVDAQGAGSEGGHHGIHLPLPSVFPLIAALGLPIIAFGFVYFREPWGEWALPLIPVGVMVLLAGIFGWGLEPAAE